MKKHSNAAEKCEPSKKRAISRIPVRRDAREVMADLVVQLTKQLDGKSLPVAEETKGGRDVVKPNLDRLTVGVDLGDEWSNYCILGLGGETLAEGQFRTRQQDIAEFSQGLATARVVTLKRSGNAAWFISIATCGRRCRRAR